MTSALRFRVESLHVHPVKACAGIRVSRLTFGADGVVEHDREWVIVDGAGEVTWQGAVPRLALVRPALAGPGVVLTAGRGGHAAALVPGSLRPIRAWNDARRRMDELEGEDGGDEAAALLAEITGAALRAVRLARGARLREGVAPVHVASASSLREVNRALAAAGAAPVGMDRFRPNIVLAGDGADAWVEERLARWTWGGIDGAGGELAVVAPCVRCVVPNVDPETAARAAEPLATVGRLSRARRADGQPVFGVYARPSGAGVLEEGSEVEGELAAPRRP
jgi:uncharacterized protein YcbX